MQVKGVKGGCSYKPYAFTEQGIYMLMTVLKGERLINVKISTAYLQKCRRFVIL